MTGTWTWAVVLASVGAVVGCSSENENRTYVGTGGSDAGATGGAGGSTTGGSGGTTGGTGGATGGAAGSTGGTAGATGGTGGATGGTGGATGGTGGATGGTGGATGGTGGTGGSTGGTGGATGGTGGTGGSAGPTLHFYAWKKGATPGANDGLAAVIRVNPDRTTTVVQSWASLSDWTDIVGVPSPPGTLIFSHRNTNAYSYLNLNQKDGTVSTVWSSNLGGTEGMLWKSAFGAGAVGYSTSSGVAKYYVMPTTGAPTTTGSADEPGTGYDRMGATRTGVVIVYKSSDGSGKRGVLNASNKLTWNLTWPAGTWAGGWTHWEPLTGDQVFVYNATTGAVAIVSVPPTAAASTLGAPTGINAGVTHWISYASGYLIAYTKGTGAAWLDQTSTSSPWVTSIGAVTGLTVGWDAFVPM